MTEQDTHLRMAQALCERAHDLLISHSFAQQQLGYIHTLEMNLGEKVPQRTLLEVEIAASAKRKESSTSHHKYIAKASEHIHQAIEASITKEVNDIDCLYYEVMGIEDGVPAIFDLLAVKSASVGRLEPLVNDLSWLGRELVSLVNMPQYRKKSSMGTTVKVDTPALALRYLGLENLQWVIPTYAMRHWLPYSTEPFQLMKRKLRELSMATALAAKALAELNGAKEQHAYTLGMMLDIGKAALTRLYLRSYETTWQDRVLKARNKGHKDLHTALLELSPDPLFLRNLLLEHSAKVTQQLIENMAFRYLPFNAAMEEFAVTYLPNSHKKLSDPLPLTIVLKKAHGYALYLLLKENHFIEDDETQLWFSYLGLSDTEQKILSTCSFHGMQLTIS
ncbi:HDOD domain-containing protein [Pseudoalteromonas sp. JBTF-M23]|uniref:HDOD domain-containing protein n=1 Tax=Pseudoalteromonas caenipelagi TaxID=2726988 RepID=A0A849VEW5_9GAMM|nr:HDOD domain-containing protein [Pseudoalteromonas caenipelagi]NOU51053.1 HDOD domain-containing protein [Pseudoalteromonas caenipelagi]